MLASNCPSSCTRPKYKERSYNIRNMEQNVWINLFTFQKYFYDKKNRKKK